MRILISSTRFAPDIGGIETCSELLALEWKNMGHDVTIVTETKSNDASHNSGLNVIRNPSIPELFKLVGKCDVYFHNNVSLKTAWPLLFINKPWFVTTATWIRRVNGTTALVDRFKKYILRYANHIYISRAVKDHIGYPGPIIGNPFSHEFSATAISDKRNDLVFVGRLVSDKGCHVLINALSILKSSNIELKLSIIGDGPEMDLLVQQAKQFGLQSQVEFFGLLSGEQLRKEMGKCKIMVVPSLWEEPFGIVALEGMACGCVPIVSEKGGLKDAIGHCGLTFPNGDPKALADTIKKLLRDEALFEDLKKKTPLHLEKFNASAVARKYVDAFEKHIEK